MEKLENVAPVTPTSDFVKSCYYLVCFTQTLDHTLHKFLNKEILYIDGLGQECNNSVFDTLELPQFSVHNVYIFQYIILSQIP